MNSNNIFAKVLYLLLVIVMALTVVACNAGGDTENGGGTDDNGNNNGSENNGGNEQGGEEGEENENQPCTHTFGEWSVKTAASCTAEGVEKRVCSLCSESEERPIEKAQHTGGTAYCNAKAICEVCSTPYGEFAPQNHASDEYAYNLNVDDANKHDIKYACCQILASVEAHTYNNGEVTEEPTDTEEGLMTYNCIYCNHAKTETIPTTSHVHSGVKTDAKDPDCTTDGNVDYWYCDGCRKYAIDADFANIVPAESVIIPASHVGGTATCKTQAVCSRCTTPYGILDATNHESTEFTYTVNETDNTKHDKKYSCCDALVETVAHSGGTANCKNKAVCADCSVAYGTINAANHESNEFTYTVNADDNTKHDKKHSCCDALVETVAHSGGTASCKNKAVCADCSVAYGTINAANHESNEFTYTVNADDNTKHDKKHSCCDKLVETASHTGGTATCQSLASCQFCNTAYGTVSDHSVKVLSSVSQSCTTDAKIVYKCEHCTYSYETIGAAKTGHSVAVWSVDSTVKVDGENCKYTVTYKGYCSICEKSDATKTEVKTIHEYAAAIKTSATCVSEGTKTYTCVNCDDSYDAPYTNSEAHSFVNDGEVIDGVQLKKCNNGDCAATKNVIVIGDSTHTVDKSKLSNTELQLGDVALKLDSATLTAIGEGNVTISATELSTEDRNGVISSLDESKKTLVGNSAIYDFGMATASGAVTSFNNGYVTVTLPYTLGVDEDPDLIVVWFISDDGEIESIGATYTDGFVTFRTNHFSNYTVVSVEAEDACAVNGHNEIKGETVAPTCTLDGYTVYTCSRCGNIRFGDIVYTSGHRFGDAVHTAPDCTAAGSNVYTCTVDGCGYVSTMVIPAQHSWVRDYENSLSATCLNEGYDAYKCSKCDATKKVTTPVSEYGHDYSCNNSEMAMSANRYELLNEEVGCSAGIRFWSECNICGHTEGEFVEYYHQKTGEFSEEYINISDYITVNGNASFVLSYSKCSLCDKVSYESLRLNDESWIFNGANLDMYFQSEMREEEYVLQTAQQMWSDPIHYIKVRTYIEADENNTCLKSFKLDIMFEYDSATDTAESVKTVVLNQSVVHRTAQDVVLKVEGGTCDMGVVINWKCQDCGTVTGSQSTTPDKGSHYLYDVGLLNWADLSEYSSEGHKTYIKEYRCPCGSDEYKVISEYDPRVGRCSFSLKSTTTEGDWTVKTYECSCGISYQELTKSVKLNECTTNHYNKMRWNYDEESDTFTEDTPLYCMKEYTYHWAEGKSVYSETEYPCYYHYQNKYICSKCNADCSAYYYCGEGYTYRHEYVTEKSVDKMGNVTTITTCKDCDYRSESLVVNGREVSGYSYSYDVTSGLYKEVKSVYSVIGGFDYETYRLVNYYDPESSEIVRWEQTVKVYNIGTAEGCFETVYTIKSDGDMSYVVNNLCEMNRGEYVYKESTCTEAGYSGYICYLCQQFRYEYKEDYAWGHYFEPFYMWDDELMMDKVLFFYCQRCGVEHHCAYDMPHSSNDCESFSCESKHDDEYFTIKYTSKLSDISSVTVKFVIGYSDNEGNAAENELDVQIVNDGSCFKVSKDEANTAAFALGIDYYDFYFVVSYGTGSNAVTDKVFISKY